MASKWVSNLVNFLLLRQQARTDGATAQEANTAAVVQTMLTKEPPKKEDKKP